MSWLRDLFQHLFDLLWAIADTFAEIVRDVVFMLFGILMDVVDSLVLMVMQIFEPVDIGQYMSGFPPEAAWMLAQLGLPQAIAMILTSISIRILLQLVPMTRLGS